MLNRLSAINNHKFCGRFLFLLLLFLFLFPLLHLNFFVNIFLNIYSTYSLHVHMFLVSSYYGTTKHGQRETKEKTTKSLSFYSNCKQIQCNHICKLQSFGHKWIHTQKIRMGTNRLVFVSITVVLITTFPL